MNKILVASDTHGKNENLRELMRRLGRLDMFIFCGDGSGLEYDIRDYVGETCAVYMVRGNNDLFSKLPWDREFKLGGLKAFLTHGHRYGISGSLERILSETRSRGCGICFFGHTHRPLEEKIDGIYLINPGSLSYPRQEDLRPSYMLIEEEKESGRLHFHQAYLDR